jgi:hypothetical protein
MSRLDCIDKRDAKVDARLRTCQQCGMLCDRAGEFHSHLFCILKKAGRDPWQETLWLLEGLGIDITHWPKSPPLVRDIRPHKANAVASTRKGQQ